MIARLTVCLVLLAACSRDLFGLEWAATRIVHQADLLDDSAKTAFTFTNAGGAPVTITDIRSSCGCTVPELAKRRYEPGESGEVRVVFNFSGRSGPQSKTVTVVTDEPDTPSYTLTLETDIPQLFDLDRYFVVWRRGFPATPQAVSFRVHEPAKAKLLAATPNDARFTATIEADTDSEPGHYRVLIAPENTAEVMQGNIVLKTDFPADNPRSLTIYALVR